MVKYLYLGDILVRRIYSSYRCSRSPGDRSVYSRGVILCAGSDNEYLGIGHVYSPRQRSQG